MISDVTDILRIARQDIERGIKAEEWPNSTIVDISQELIKSQADVKRMKSIINSREADIDVLVNAIITVEITDNLRDALRQVGKM